MPASLPEVVLSPEVTRMLNPRAKRELVIPDKCPQQVLELVAWLKQTGTGLSKLQALLNLGCEVEGSKDFYDGAKALVGEGTLAKIAAYIAAASEAKAAAPVAPQASAAVVAEHIKERMEENKADEGVESKGKKSK